MDFKGWDGRSKPVTAAEYIERYVHQKHQEKVRLLVDTGATMYFLAPEDEIPDGDFTLLLKVGDTGWEN